MNNKLWAGRFSKELNKVADDFNSSIPFDSRMYSQDIKGSIAHATMLGMQGIITIDEAHTIIDELVKIEEDITEGRLAIDMSAEDIHMFVETVLTERIGDVGKKLHTARSRNDQVAVDIRLWLKDETDNIIENICSLIEALTDKADEFKDAIMPGYTHMQRAQPITLGHHLMAYVSMFMRDIERLSEASARMMSSSPLGSCALAGTTYNTDRQRTADILGFQYPCRNSLDGVSDRDFAIELCCAYSVAMMHISRLSEEIILWSSWEFKFVELDDSFSTGSSIMPQKKNPDMAELARGKTGRVYGDLITLLTVMKGTPLAYNKDMQEDKEAIFDAVDTLKACLSVFAPMIATMRPIRENMYSAAQKGFINATDVADYLVGKGLPFRSAYKITGQLVGKCVADGKVLDSLSLDEYREFSELFDEDLYGYISLESCVSRRTSYGGTSPESVASQIEFAREFLDAFKTDEE